MTRPKCLCAIILSECLFFSMQRVCVCFVSASVFMSFVKAQLISIYGLVFSTKSWLPNNTHHTTPIPTSHTHLTHAHTSHTHTSHMPTPHTHRYKSTLIWRTPSVRCAHVWLVHTSAETFTVSNISVVHAGNGNTQLKGTKITAPSHAPQRQHTLCKASLNFWFCSIVVVLVKKMVRSMPKSNYKYLIYNLFIFFSHAYFHANT